MIVDYINPLYLPPVVTWLDWYVSQYWPIALACIFASLALRPPKQTKIKAGVLGFVIWAIVTFVIHGSAVG